MIKAEGKKNGKKMIVEYDSGKFTFNGADDEILDTEIRILLKAELPIFGTYVSTDETDELNIIGTLERYFYDDRGEIITAPDITVESEKGVVY